LSLWWLGLHLLLTVAALLAGWSWSTKVAVIVAVVGHAAWRRPPPPCALIEVGADGACRIPALGSAPFVLGARTRLSPFWVRIVARNGAETLDLLLLIDQLNAEDWRRLTAILRRGTAR